MTESVASRVMTMAVRTLSNRLRKVENTVMAPRLLKRCYPQGVNRTGPAGVWHACRAGAVDILHSSAEFDGLLDEFGTDRHGLAELLIHALAGGNEGILVGLVDLGARGRDLLEQFVVEIGRRLVDEGLNVLGRLGQDLLDVLRQRLELALARGQIGRG